MLIDFGIFNFLSNKPDMERSHKANDKFNKSNSDADTL